MKNVLMATAACILLIATGKVPAEAQNPDKQPTPEEMATAQTERLEKLLKLEDWQVFYVDSTLQHDYVALDAELKGMQKAMVGNVDLYMEVQDRWMERIDGSFRKWFTPEQWKKYLKSGAGKAQKAREKRRAKAAKATQDLSEF